MTQEMDFKSVIYNAARDGKLRRLKVFLDHRSKDEVLLLVGAKTNGATPLVMACRHGHYDVAEYLIERCHADIEQPGSVVFDGETIEGAPPLWCAAAAGHLPVVRLLVRHGACVNSTTRTNSTPLRAACFDGHFEIVKFLVDHGADIEVANRHGHTCLMIACYKGHFRIAKFLLSLDANVNRKSVKGNTALHDCAESGSLDILKLLIEHGAKMDVDSYGMTPLLAASVTGHTHIVEYLIQLPNLVSRVESVDALELLGATYVDKKRDMIGALELWKRAMHDRYLSGEPELPKPVITQTVPAYDHAKEVSDPSGLTDLLADPDEMRMQALLIRERILGPAHPDTSYYIRYRGAVYADAGKFTRCMSLWNYALDMQQRMLEPLNPMTQSSLFSFTELFAFMLGEHGRPSPRGRRVPPADPHQILEVLKKAENEVAAGLQLSERSMDPAALRRVVVMTLQLAALVARIVMLPEEKPANTREFPPCNLCNCRYCFHEGNSSGRPKGENSEDSNTDDNNEKLNAKEQLHRILYSLLKHDINSRLGCTVLHLACTRDGGRYPACQLPAAPLCEALLKSGADPNARDNEGMTPLHRAAALLRPCPPSVADCLLRFGAHLDAVDARGHTFQQLLEAGQAIHDVVDVMKYTSLQCLAARAVRKCGLPYNGIIPPSLVSFVNEH